MNKEKNLLEQKAGILEDEQQGLPRRRQDKRWLDTEEFIQQSKCRRKQLGLE